MQLAIYEILFVKDVPTGVAISEAVRLSKKYDSDETGSFVNGIHGSFARSLDNPAPQEVPVQEPSEEASAEEPAAEEL